jgi:hypothetical protein
MATREKVPFYVPDSSFHPPHIDGLLPHFAILPRLLRQALASRIGNANAIPANERNLLDATMKNEHFDAFDYIVDEICNIAINPLRSYGFTPYIMCMIEMVAHLYLCWSDGQEFHLRWLLKLLWRFEPYDYLSMYALNLAYLSCMDGVMNMWLCYDDCI